MEMGDLESVQISKNNVPCPFSNGRCKEVLPPSKIQEHLFHCDYATVNFCSLLGLDCTEDVTRADLSQHFTSNDHGPCIVKYVEGGALTIFQNVTNFEKKKHTYLALINTERHTFALKCSQNTENKLIAWMVVLLGTEKEAYKFDSYIKLIPTSTPSEDELEDCSDILLEWKGRVSSVESTSTIPKIKDIFFIPYGICPSLVSFQERKQTMKWKLELKICKNSEEIEEEEVVENVVTIINPEEQGEHQRELAMWQIALGQTILGLIVVLTALALMGQLY